MQSEELDELAEHIDQIRRMSVHLIQMAAANECLLRTNKAILSAIQINLGAAPDGCKDAIHVALDGFISEVRARELAWLAEQGIVPEPPADDVGFWDRR